MVPETMKRISSDFCWAFLNDYITLAQNDVISARAWISFLRKFSKTDYVTGQCACCLDRSMVKSGSIRCKWVWKDICKKIKLLNTLDTIPV